MIQGEQSCLGPSGVLDNQCWGYLDRIQPTSLYASLNPEDFLPSLQKREDVRLVAYMKSQGLRVRSGVYQPTAHVCFKVG